MDDIIESTEDLLTAQKLTSDIENLIIKGGFHVKGWIFSDDPNNQEKTVMPNEPNTSTEKVLGIIWNPVKDYLCFEVKLDFSRKKNKLRTERNLKINQLPNEIPEQLTKRIILSQVNSIYDPLGLAGPFTVRAKIMMRQIWASDVKIDWDDPIPEENRRDWIMFFKELFEMDNVKFERCMKPHDAVGDPILIIFSDGSNQAFGACAYVRWELQNGLFESNLILSKNRLAPVKKMSIDRIELCGAIINKRLKVLIQQQCRYQFQRFYHIVDSQIVHAMIQKDSYGFNTFAATRIGEIQEGTNPKDWHWIESEYNIADWLTRGKKPNEIGFNSAWQEGPTFLKQPESEWPITRNYTEQQLPEMIKAVTVTTVITKDDITTRINIDNYSSYKKLLRVTARVLSMYRRDPKPTFLNVTKEPTAEDLRKAEVLWIKESQRNMDKEIKEGKYKRLCPRLREDEIYVVGDRATRWMEMSYNKNEVILLPYEHRFSRLYAEYIHNRGHYGVSTTASKIRSRFWIVKLLKMTKSIKHNCIMCKRLDKKLSEQVMGKLPEERLKPAPAWHCTAIDLFGPFKIKDEVKKRTTGKAYGVIFNCLGTRAVYVDLAADYSTEKFLMVLRRFVSLRGYPSKLYSDNGPQLVAANEELKSVTKGWKWEELKAFGTVEGFQWEFTTADAPWQNGVSEALVKSVKRAITAAINESILTFSELQTVLFEIANLVNERPIGRHPTSPDDGTYLCPNDLLLGRSTSRVPSGPFKTTSNPRHRFEFIQGIVTNFWKKWTRDYFPSLIIRQKWHTAHRNMIVGDIVLMQDSNQIRGQWKLGRVSKVYTGEDGKVRKVEVQYKNPKPGEPVTKYKGRGYVTVERAVHRLIVLLPALDNKETN